MNDSPAVHAPAGFDQRAWRFIAAPLPFIRQPDDRDRVQFSVTPLFGGKDCTFVRKGGAWQGIGPILASLG
jgi:hypothetical protein